MAGHLRGVWVLKEDGYAVLSRRFQLAEGKQQGGSQAAVPEFDSDLGRAVVEAAAEAAKHPLYPNVVEASCASASLWSGAAPMSPLSPCVLSSPALSRSSRVCLAAALPRVSLSLVRWVN